LFNTVDQFSNLYCLADSSANGCVGRETGLNYPLLHHLEISRS
jgi:hypothetical protein